MIRTDAEYEYARARIKDEKRAMDLEKSRLEAEGLTAQELRRLLDPMETFHIQFVEEVEAYEKLKRGEFDELLNLQGFGPLLIGLRIYLGVSQRQLAERLGVHESQVSRDERNDYHGITLERVTKILDALGVSLKTTVEVPAPSAA
jgi:DNA-binding transcriptional regulator YiaG